MARTHGGTTARRPAALLTGLLLSTTMLAGCSADGEPVETVTEAATGPSSDATPTASPSPSETAETSPSPSEEPAPDPTPRQEEPEEPDESEEPRADDDAPGRSDDKEDDRAGKGDDKKDGKNEDAEEDAEPELPEFVAFGENSERVTELQSRLQELGYFITTVDGSYGGETQQALWAMQKAGGLHRDGVVGPDTQKALDKGTRPQAKSSSGKVVEIDIGRQILLAVEDGKIVKTINAASGNGERFEAKGRTYYASTPRGDFSIYNQIDGMHASTLELGDMWRPKYFNGAIAVHGSSSVPPFPASHGCVRVTPAAMNWIWDTWGAPTGTRVLVY